MKTLSFLVLISGLAVLSSAQAFAMVEPPTHVPDTASTVALLGVGLVGLLGVRRWMAKR